MNKYQKLAVYFLSATLILVLVNLSLGDPIMGGRSSSSYDYSSANQLDGDSTTNGATTTPASSLPLLVLESNDARKGAIVINDSDTIMYLHLQNFDDLSAASTTVTINSGIRLNASGGSYEITSGNLYSGDIYATSTASAKNISYIEFE